MSSLFLYSIFIFYFKLVSERQFFFFRSGCLSDRTWADNMQIKTLFFFLSIIFLVSWSLVVLREFPFFFVFQKGPFPQIGTCLKLLADLICCSGVEIRITHGLWKLEAWLLGELSLYLFIDVQQSLFCYVFLMISNPFSPVGSCSSGQSSTLELFSVYLQFGFPICNCLLTWGTSVVFSLLFI